MVLQLNAKLLRSRFNLAVAVAEAPDRNANEKDGDDEGKDAGDDGAAEPRAPGQDLEKGTRRKKG